MKNIADKKGIILSNLKKLVHMRIRQDFSIYETIQKERMVQRHEEIVKMFEKQYLVKLFDSKKPMIEPLVSQIK